MEAFQSRLSDARAASTVSAPVTAGIMAPPKNAQKPKSYKSLSNTQICAIVGLLGLAVFCLAFQSRSSSKGRSSQSSDDPLFQPF